MRVLVYGAGPLGSLFAARLHQGGNKVTILARGQRLKDIKKYGIVIHESTDNHIDVVHVPVVEELSPAQTYDLIMVIMRKNNALQILPILAENSTADVLFLMNNAAGPDVLIQALGAHRVLTGFPTAAGYRQDHTIHVLAGNEEKPSPIPFGEVDGTISARTYIVAHILDSMPGFKAEIRTNMDTWSKYHVALLMPSLAPALYMCNTDNMRMSKTRDAIVMAIRAIREGFAVLQSLGYPITPGSLRKFAWIPEPILVTGFKMKLADPRMEIAMVRHANNARDEVKHLVDEFMTLASQTDVPTPYIHRLYPHLEVDAPHMEEGSRAIPLDWRQTAALSLLAVLLTICILGWHLPRKQTSI